MMVVSIIFLVVGSTILGAYFHSLAIALGIYFVIASLMTAMIGVTNDK